MPFLPDAIRMPWNRVPAAAAPNTSMLYPKSDNNWYTRDSAGVEALVGGPTEQAAWTAFTPAWTSTGTAPAIGNGVLSGRYSKIGKTVTLAFNFTAGTTTTFGTGTYRWSFPVPSVTGLYVSQQFALGGWVHGEDAGLVAFAFFPRWVSTTTFELVYHSVTTAGALQSQVTSTAPFTWADTDSIRGTITYEAA